MTRNPRTTNRRTGFSLVEMLIALTISSMLLTGALVALDAMFKGYKQTTESASTHVVSRIVVNRLLSMVRTGSDFGPFPVDVLDACDNPISADYFEFVSQRDTTGEPTRITRIEYRRDGADAPDLLAWGACENRPAPPGDPVIEGPGELWYVLIDPTAAPPAVLEEHPLLSGVRTATFTLSYNVGPRLDRATIDLVIEPNDSVDLTIGADAVPETIRMVASAAPRVTYD